MKRTRKSFVLEPLINAVLIACSVLSVSVALFTTGQNKALREQNRILLEREGELPESFGGVGYISNKGDGYIDVVGYGRFLINEDEAQFLDEGDKAPQYILERGI